MKPWLQWTIGVVLVAAAWGVAALTPAEDAREAPFAVPATLGEPAAGRNIETTVSSVQRADHVTAGDWSADGNWVVVYLTAQATQTEPAGLNLATLTVGDRVFRASERPDSLADRALNVGIPQSGSLAFELPAGLDAGTATLTLGLNTVPRLDSMIVLDVDLATLPHPPGLELDETRWTNG